MSLGFAPIATLYARWALFLLDLSVRIANAKRPRGFGVLVRGAQPIAIAPQTYGQQTQILVTVFQADLEVAAAVPTIDFIF